MATVEYVYLEAEFLQPCSPVELVGEIGESSKFTVNAALDDGSTRAGQLRVVAFNSDHATRTWLEDERLEKVIVEYKPVGSTVWLSARFENATEMDIRASENEYGYVTAWWDVSTLTAGEYEMRIRAQCTASINEMPDGIDENYSHTALGFVDRTAPVVLGYPAPADGEYEPGDDIAFEFDEPVQCTKPHWFQVQLEVEGLDRLFNNDNMVIVCEGREVRMSLRRGFDWGDVAGKSATVSLSNLQDVYGNVAERDFVHTFRFAVVEVSSLALEVTGIRLSSPYVQEYLDHASVEYMNLTLSVQDIISASTGIEGERVVLSSVVPTTATDFSAGTTVSVFLLPTAVANSTEETRRRRAESITASSAALLLSAVLNNGTAQGTGGGMVSNTTLVDVEVVASNSELAQRFVVNDEATTTLAPDSGASTGGSGSSDEDKAICELEGWREGVCACVCGCVCVCGCARDAACKIQRLRVAWLAGTTAFEA